MYEKIGKSKPMAALVLLGWYSNMYEKIGKSKLDWFR